VLIDIFDYQDVLVLRFPADLSVWSVADAVDKECRDAADFFRPDGVVIDLTGTAAGKFLVTSAYHLVVLGKKWGFRVATAGRKNEIEAMLKRIQILQYTAGCYDTVEEAIPARFEDDNARVVISPIRQMDAVYGRAPPSNTEGGAAASDAPSHAIPCCHQRLGTPFQLPRRVLPSRQADFHRSVNGRS
jgi:hypothetical protein